MLTRRGWWFFLVVVLVLVLSLWTYTPAVSLLALTLLLWFLASWLLFSVRTILVHGRLGTGRELRDEQGPVQSLWVGRTFAVRVRLINLSLASLPYVRVQERVPFGVKKVRGVTHAEGPMTSAAALEVAYDINCQAPGRVRFEGLSVQLADIQGFFYRTFFVKAVQHYRVLPALADAKGHFPTKKRHNLLPLIGAHRHRRPGSGSELLDLRDYLPGDPPKMIAWKPSARRDRLMTKEFESEVPIRCTLFVDTSSSVRVGLPGRNALARLVEMVAAIAQANSAARDLTGLCLFDEHDIALVKPARSPRHMLQLYAMLADVANLAPATGEVAVQRLLPLAYGLAEEVYPHLLEPDVNYFPWWLPLWSPQPAYTLRRPPRRGHGLGRWLSRHLAYFADAVYQQIAGRLAFADWKDYRWRKQLASIFAARYRLGPGMLAVLLEDDDRFVLEMQRFLNEHHVPFELPFYGPDNEYLFAAPAKVEVLARALRGAVGRGRDNELFVLMADLLEIVDRLDPLVAAVKMAVARHHQVMVVCPWPPGIPPPDRSAREGEKREEKFKAALSDLVHGTRSTQVLELILRHTTMLRLHHAYEEVRHTFARLGVPVLCARHDESVQLILNRLERLRVLERGVR
jgi:uncharacterized protein (DUF58 family)